MTENLSLEKVEALVAQLRPQDQLELVARIGERLREVVGMPPAFSRKEAERLRKERERRAAAILRECDRAAAAFTRKTDSVETIRRMRDERDRQICLNE